MGLISGVKSGITVFAGWIGWGGAALRQAQGRQLTAPSSTLVPGTNALGADGALQISTVWGCISLLVNIVSTLPIMVYKNNRGNRDLARDSQIWFLLHVSPNQRMTPAEFWGAMVLNLVLRGNAYARIIREADGRAIALWPMSADQTEMQILENGSIVYVYRINNDLMVMAEENVLHIKGMGNGNTGLSRLDYMKATTSEATNATVAANKLFTTGGKPTGILMIDRVLQKDQREAVRNNFAEMAVGNESRLFLMEADMKYQQINLTPEDMQLLTTRQFGVEEITRWFGVPAVLVNHANVSVWGSGIEEIVAGFHKFVIRPMLVNIEQAITKRVLTVKQGSQHTVEYNFEALLRASIKDRYEVYAKGVQNGLLTRNEVRQLENSPQKPGGDDLTVQSNLIPIDKLGQVPPKAPSQPEGTDGNQNVIAQ